VLPQGTDQAIERHGRNMADGGRARSHFSD
jgi:hypothetical protein